MNLSEKEIQGYKETGYFKVSGLVPISILSSYKSGLLRLIEARGQNFGISTNQVDLDVAFNQLCNFDRTLGGDIYDHAKELPEFYSCMVLPEIQALIQQLLGNEVIQVAQSQCVFRIDRPREDKFGFGWHQDYWYNCLTPSAITVWIPITNVDEELGPLEIIPGSHAGILPVVVLDPTNSNGNMASVFRISELTQIAEENTIKIPMQAGDALFFHSQLLHRSGANRSNRSRWTLQYRYADFLDKTYSARAWAHGTYRGKVTFCDVHPELIASR